MESKSGVGVWFGPDDARNVGVVLPADAHTSKYEAELVAVTITIRAVPTDTPVLLMSKTSSVSTSMSKHLRIWEDKGWSASVSASAPCRSAEDLARTAITEGTGPTLPVDNSGAPAIVGAKLSTMTQKLAYQSIRARKKTLIRKGTGEIMGLVQEAVKISNGRTPQESSVWKSVRHRDFTCQFRDFLWRAMHRSIRVGHYWAHIPGYEDRATCKHCDEEESLQHILVGCKRTGQALIWELASNLWVMRTGTPLPKPIFRGILGCGMTLIEAESKKKPSGPNRLYRLLISESCYLIWKLRNESVISNGGAEPSTSEVKNRWIHTMNDRLETDCYLATHTSQKDRAGVPPALVLRTWHKTLLEGENLPKDWLREPRVLVGILANGSDTFSPPSSRRDRHS
ncbi:hypothetical protein B0H16DRAFT_1732621 [Mycena metata]|uniref:Reverse transcriptase zinc-binding domain-containing protein n=1 Tax=Mycena metata TaxID=1033252 RepID=A0AAD7I1F8_9AGAR|nr:hypothetical protein B0H16DRAFT_1732621 [Mycena metata]